MATSHKLTLVPYLQEWDAGSRTLALRLLVTPAGNPLAPLVSNPAGVPAFADATMAFDVRLSDAIEALPERSTVSGSVTAPAAPAGHPHARPIFEAIKQALNIPDGPAGDTFTATARDPARQIRKYLPTSYRGAFGFVRPRTSLAVVDDTYQCLMKCPPDPEPPKPPMVIGWGEAIAFALRQPRLAEALGLVVPLEIVVPAGRFSGGGWLWVDLAASSDYTALAGTPGFVRQFAARVPSLGGDDRSLFTPVIFPVSADATEAAGLGNYDKVFVEAIRFDDGFSKIVHARQPLSSDVLDETGGGPAIVRDEGVQLAWDDEDILEGQNRSLGAPPDGEDPVVAPRGVFGYRVDVRRTGTVGWTSLSRVSAPLNVGVDLGTAVEERWTEVVPATHSGQTWLAPWYAKWRGRSLVADTPDDQRLMEVEPGSTVRVVPVDADAVELRYGRRYDFRVRLVDTTGGGPDLIAATPTAGEAPVSTLHFRRYRKPAAPRFDPVEAPADGRTGSLTVRRPRLGFPEGVFAGGASARAELLAQIAANDAGDPADAVPPSVADPDVAFVAVRVLLKAPTFDPFADADGYYEWYATTRAFPAGVADPLTLGLTWIDTADYTSVDISAQLGAEGAVNGPIVLPTARDVRLELHAVGRNDLVCFANQQARHGAVDFVDLHGFSTAESAPLRALVGADTLRSVFLRHDPAPSVATVTGVAAQSQGSPVLLARLAAASDLRANGTLLTGEEGIRTVFSCAGIAHHVAPDGSSLEFGDPTELAEQWINVVCLALDRDWTWRGAGSPTITLTRTLSLHGVAGTSETIEVGTIELMPSISTQASIKPDRSHTRFVFVDAFTPRLGFDGLPYELDVSYSARLRFENADSVVREIDTQLPIVTPPKQFPVVVAAGIALTAYSRDDAYASTSSRTRRLWIEFAEPLADLRDAYFARAQHSTPDPLLLPGAEPLADPLTIDSPVLDPELVRVITPGQVQDLAGLAAMQRLEPSSTSNRQFLLPLPPNTSPGSPELFSFYTYEFRVGHDRGDRDDPLWSTAQGRFGGSLVLEGVQHPVPELICSVVHAADAGVDVRAPFAAPYIGLRRALPNPPNTELWAVLYAQVAQADAATNRNVQLRSRRLLLPRRHEETHAFPPQAGLAVEGITRWTRAEIDEALQDLGLGRDSALSVLAIELLPEPNGEFHDPIGGDLGEVRILRTSPLAPVPAECCTHC